MLELSQLRADTNERRRQLTQFPAIPNPPKWSSFTSSGSGFQVVLIPPTIDNAAASDANNYLPQGIGSDFPSTNQNQQNQTTAAINVPTFLYQVQIATDNVFTQNVQTFDMGTSLTTTIPATGSQFAQARCKFINSPYSAWRPFAGTATNGPTYRPFEFTTSGTVNNPFQAIDGNVATFAQVVGNAGSVTYGPFSTLPQLTNGLTLSVISAQTVNPGGASTNIKYSVDAGASYTTIRTDSAIYAQTTDTVTLPNNFNLGLLRVQANSSGGATVNLNLYEIFVQ